MDTNKLKEYLRLYYYGCKYIYTHYGFKHQTRKLLEELDELKAAIAKNDLQNMLEEMADVSVLIDQFTINSQTWERQIQKIKMEKVQRQVKRINEEDKK